MEHDNEYEVIEIPKTDAEKYGVDVRPEAEFESIAEGEANHG